MAVLAAVAVTTAASACGAVTPVAPSLTPAAAPSSTAAPPTLPRWTISGTVRDLDDGFGVQGVAVMLTDRFEPRSTTTDEMGHYTFDAVGQSGVGMVFSRSGYVPLTVEQVLPVEDLTMNVAIKRDCHPRPAPVALSYTLSGQTVTFTWPEVAVALEYRLAVGQWDYVSPVFSVTTTGTTYEWLNAPPGTYHARVQGRGACGYGNAANELKVIVP